MRILASILFAALAANFAIGQSTEIQAAATASPAAELSPYDAIVLGMIEGVTEYLPVSSTGHLIIATRALGLESETPLRDKNGQPLWYKKPSAEYPEGKPLTVKLAADTYNVIIQFGAIAAVAILYWAQLLSMVKGAFGRDPAGLRLLINVIIAFVPAAAVGFLLHDWIDQNLFSVSAVIVAQVGGAVLMFAAEAWRKRRHAARAHGTGELTPKAAVGIGALQCLSMWPGTSRSMTTIVGGYFAGLDPRKAAEFSFILGFVTLSAATLYKCLKSGGAMVQVFGWSNMLLGCVVATFTAVVCVRFLVSWLTRHGLGIFAWYRLALAAVLAFLYLR